MTPLLPDDASFVPNDGPGPTLVAFDFDGTLAEHRGGWSLLYRLFGVEDGGEARTTAYWDGELSYEEWVGENITDWRDRGVRREHVERAADAVKLTAGARDLLFDLSVSSVPFGVISAGVRDLIRPIERFGPAFVISNEIVYEDGVPVDVVPRVPPGAKGDLLTDLCENAGVDPSDIVYVGDSRSDEEAFEIAGTAVLVDPDSQFRDSAYRFVDHRIAERDLSMLRSLVLPTED